MPPLILSAAELVPIAGGRPPFAAAPPFAVELFNDLRQDYAAIYRTQPNVRTVVGFLARNIAQLGFHLYERAADDDRRRLPDHDFARRLRHPNPLDPRMTRYRMTHALVRDLGVFDVAYWAFVGDGPGGPALLRLPPQNMKALGASWLWPDAYELTKPDGSRVELPAGAVAQFVGSVGLEDPFYGEPPIEALRRILAEDEAAGEYREQFWRNGARLSGWIERPASAPRWSREARDRFRQSWQALFAGAGPLAGGSPILEDGMRYHDEGASNARDSQYVESRQLSRVEVAAAYHVDPVFVGVTETAGRASMEERHKALYMDTLAPWTVMIEQDLTAQVLPAFVDDPAELDRLYVEANIAAKLRGTPADMADALARLVGRPILTANEGRALLNRNGRDDGDGLVVPLNVILGGQTVPGAEPLGASPATAAAPPARHGRKASARLGGTRADRLRLEAERLTVAALERTFARQRAAFLSAFGAARPGATVDDLFDRARWDPELAADLLGPAIATADLFADAYADTLAGVAPAADTRLAYLTRNAEIAAANVNATTADRLARALRDPEDAAAAVRNVWTVAAGARAAQIATTRVTGLAGFAGTDTATANGYTAKAWLVTSAKPRPSHAAMDGETVPIGSPFSLGGAWPGDPAMGVDEVAGCSCLLEFVR